jgi:autotransporter translocation and assembly factor TamB
METVKKISKFLLYGISLGIVLFLLIISAVYLGLQTDNGREFIGEYVTSLLQSEDMQFDFGEISGSLPAEIRVKNVRIRDKEGAWLTLEGLRIDWSPFALFRSKLNLKKVHIDRVKLDRLPKSKSENTDLSLPILPFSFALKEFSVDQLDMGAAIAGTPSSFKIALEAYSSLFSRGISGDVQIVRVDNIDGAGYAKFDVNSHFNNSTMDVKWQEKSGGFLDSLNTDGGDVKLQLAFDSSHGPWDGTLNLDIGDQFYHATLHKDQRNKMNVNIDHNLATIKFSGEGSFGPSQFLNGDLIIQAKSEQFPIKESTNYLVIDGVDGQFLYNILGNIISKDGSPYFLSSIDYSLNGKASFKDIVVDRIALKNDYVGGAGKGHYVYGETPYFDFLLNVLNIANFGDYLGGNAALFLTQKDKTGIHANLKAKHVVAHDAQIGDIDIDCDLNGNKFELSGVIGKDDSTIEINGNGGFTSENITVNALHLSHDDGKFDFKGIFDFASILLDGEAVLDIKDLQVISNYFPMIDIGGASLASIKFVAGTGRQNLDITVNAKQLSMDEESSLALAVIKANIQDLHDKPYVTASCTLQDLKHQDLTINRIIVGSVGDFAKMQTSLQATGRYIHAFDLNLASELSFDRGINGQLKKLLGKIDRKPFHLHHPVKFTFNEQKYNIAPFKLAFLGGLIAGKYYKDVGNVDYDVTLEQIPLSIIKLFMKDSRFEGKLNASCSMKGDMGDPVGKIDAKIDHLSYGFSSTKWPPFEAVLQGDYKNNTLSFESELINRVETKDHIKMAFELPMNIDKKTGLPLIDKQKTLKGSSIGAINVDYFTPFFLPEDDIISAIVDVDLKMSGSLENPNYNGALKVKDGLYENGRFGTMVDDIVLDLQLKDQSLLIKDLHGAYKKGTVKADGNLELTGDIPFKISLDTKNFRFYDTDEGRIDGDARLSLTGELLKKLDVAGNIKILKGDIELPRNIAEREVDIPIEGLEEQFISPPSGINFDLQVKIENNIGIRGYGIESEWHGALKVKGAIDQPNIEGGILLAKGKYDLIGTKFDLKRGKITFENETGLIPFLDIYAESSRKDLIARVEINGPLDDPRISFHSTPEMPQNEVLSHVLFKQGTAQLSPIQLLKLGQVYAKMSGSAAGEGLDFFDSLQRNIGFEFDIEGGKEEGDKPRVRAGKRISDKIKIMVEEDIETNTTYGKVQSDIASNISLETGLSNDGQGTLGVVGHWEY